MVYLLQQVWMKHLLHELITRIHIRFKASRGCLLCPILYSLCWIGYQCLFCCHALSLLYSEHRLLVGFRVPSLCSLYRAGADTVYRKEGGLGNC